MIDRDRCWVKRFHRDEKTWGQHLKVF
ncbi:hypothetical protein [Synechococcus sp. CC9311]|nr:hypothetical protein [Synechococcus sp. CC9311]